MGEEFKDKNPALTDRKNRIQMMYKLLEQEEAKGIVDKNQFINKYMFNVGITKRVVLEYWDIVQSMKPTTPIPVPEKTAEPIEKKCEVCGVQATEKLKFEGVFHWFCKVHGTPKTIPEQFEELEQNLHLDETDVVKEGY